ncbi:hypothetical protein OIDMADRAFT_39755 [Oidiodendron maius Zn]|uniref:Nephrocystin 3-like N-terminal domain-containing protein n=1 Tax=Oidiodendron maius (strain Zn) TaxID=913774 RepID=A0A0C3HK34_OIDMZ|nr:hypothetical protein OIDMADRAFT_39755 [Oidiodendron maius Zn]
MADPLSVSASIIALLQLSGTVIGYFKDVKDASKDCANILLEISSASSLLHSLNNLITRSDAQGFQFAMVASLAVPYGPLDQFKSVLERLSEKICPVDRFKRAVRVIAWSLKKDEVKELLSTIERLKSLFSLALQSDNFNLSHGMEADVVEIKREVLLQASQSRRAEDLDTLKWLTATKPTEAHLRIRERRLPGTGQWLLETPEFTAWRDEEQVSNILWCHGIPGAGKTIISSIVIDHLNDKFAGQNIGAVYAYCDFNNPQSQSAVSMLANLLKQLALSNSSVMAYVTKLYERHTVLDTYPDVSELETAFLDACQDFQRIFLVVDALDECDIDIQRELVLKVLRSLKTSCVRMFVTSRPHPDDIRELFQDSPQITIEASSEDIEKYIRATIEDSGFSFLDCRFKQF